MKRLRALRIALLLLLVVHVTRAQSYVGIPSASFSYYSAAQLQTQWCWAASLQMIFNFYGVNINQLEIVTRTYGGLVDAPGSPEVITANLNNMSIDDNGRRYVVSAQYGVGAPDASRLISTLAAGQPVMIGYNTGSSGHAVVVTACSYVPGPYGPIINSIVVRDPWPSPTNVMNKGRVEYFGGDLGPRIMSHWFIQVY